MRNQDDPPLLLEESNKGEVELYEESKDKNIYDLQEFEQEQENILICQEHQGTVESTKK
ncbi:2792_t:CDS:2 [Entrophospora sp. SA101]|nr:2792_t:CDS:2 [Entrophospora sp. SA101]CAJ0910435.1 17743_t:CDS:2 [Entrophospora sp. SA101]CAJ0910459.1 17751_t:CDS:2 [Entrophospora sp. SA101]